MCIKTHWRPSEFPTFYKYKIFSDKSVTMRNTIFLHYAPAWKSFSLTNLKFQYWFTVTSATVVLYFETLP